MQRLEKFSFVDYACLTRRYRTGSPRQRNAAKRSNSVVLNLWGIPHWWGMAELPNGEWLVGQ